MTMFLRHGWTTMIRMGAAALVLALLSLAAPAGAAEHGDHHSAMANHHQATMPERPVEPEASPHHGQCHCVSAVCAPVLGAAPPMLGAVRVAIPLRHDRPVAALAQPLAGVDPPPEPPRT